MMYFGDQVIDPRLALGMRLALAGTMNMDGGLVIYVVEGSGNIRLPVVRTHDGNYACQTQQCIYKGQTAICEHVQFAREVYDTVLSPTEERKNEEKLRLAKVALDKARDIVRGLEQQLPSKNMDTVPLAGERRIVLEEK